MKKKSPILGAILGLFILGLFYATGMTKKGLIAVVGLVVVQTAVSQLIDPALAGAVSVVGLFLGAHYSPTTWYRSCDECLMRFLDRPFGAVAAEQLPVRLYSGGWQGPASSLDDRIELVSLFDNLGKGSSGAAIECLNLMTGAPETTGLNL